MDDEAPASRRAWITLSVLIFVYVFNFVDRQILAILAGRIKGDLAISDAQLGFLYGTAFAVFYAVFGIPLGLLADLGNRRSVIAVGLAFWSLMTTLSGVASSFPQLALARIGVGVGEAASAPAAYSMLSDLFPKRQRATALALYSTGIYIGSGLGLFIGAQIVERWDRAFAASTSPFGLAGWQVAFLVVGPPGILLAPFLLLIREPVRGGREGLAAKATHAHPVLAALWELASLIPPVSLVLMARRGGPWRTNLLAGAGVAFLAIVLSLWSGNWQQWVAVGFGALVAFTYAQQLRQSDPPAHALIFKTRSLALATIGFSLLAFNGYAGLFWIPAFYARYHGLPLSEIGLAIGLISSIAGLLGVTLGGLLADRFRKRSPAGRLWVGLINALGAIPFSLVALYVPNPKVSLAFYAVVQIFASLWVGAGVSTVQDLVLPRMRARASAVFLLFVTLLGLALGPFLVGRLSDLLGDLRQALLFGLVVCLTAAALFAAAARSVEADESSRAERAREAGEALAFNQ
ncbi:MAG: MFS transporter [Vicinamibacteria bacterium]|nr:MFS transporter [Vicinamibacteria bacterium]